MGQFASCILSSGLSLLVFILTPTVCGLQVLERLYPKGKPIALFAKSLLYFLSCSYYDPLLTVYLSINPHSHYFHVDLPLFPSMHLSFIFSSIHLMTENPISVCLEVTHKRRWGIIKSETWSMCGGWLNCQHKVDVPPPTLMNFSHRKYIVTLPSIAAISLFYCFSMQ